MPSSSSGPHLHPLKLPRAGSFSLTRGRFLELCRLAFVFLRFVFASFPLRLVWEPCCSWKASYWIRRLREGVLGSFVVCLREGVLESFVFTSSYGRRSREHFTFASSSSRLSVISSASVLVHQWSRRLSPASGGSSEKQACVPFGHFGGEYVKVVSRCRSLLTSFRLIRIRSSKDQNLALNSNSFDLQRARRITPHLHGRVCSQCCS